MPRLKPPIKAAIVGYGPFFNMGAHHANLMKATGRIEIVAVCDRDEKRLKVARDDLGDIKTYKDVRALANDKEVKLVAVVVPHNVHPKVAVPLLEAKKHVVVEKPFAITIKECDQMIAAAKKAGVTLSVFHNRRQDGDFRAIKDVIEQGYIGEVFHLEAHSGGYGKPRKWWRSDKRISGGAFYDWGAHFMDWVLHLVPGKMTTITGQLQKRMWHNVTNEDHCETYIHFDSGAVAHVQLSSLCAAPKARWYILGTKGAILDTGGGEFTVYTRVRDRMSSFQVKYYESAWAGYYEMLADHLIKNKPNPVTPESARRVIAVLELAERASETGKEQKVPYEK
jgi:scyllo-inositol 2-dehydrogenase (NADP+)